MPEKKQTGETLECFYFYFSKHSNLQQTAAGVWKRTEQYLKYNLIIFGAAFKYFVCLFVCVRVCVCVMEFMGGALKLIDPTTAVN